MLGLLRQFLFSLVHLVMTVLVAVQNVYNLFSTKKWSVSRVRITKYEIQSLLEHMPRISKKLKHLVLLVDTDHHSLSDLARIVIWCLVAGIPYVSFHDITGELKINEEKLFLEVEKSKKGIPGCIKWSNKRDLNGYTNGIQAHTVIINIFTAADGQKTIAQCIQQIAEEKITCRKTSKEYTAQEFDDALSIMYPSIPEPNVVLYTGLSCRTHGLLPWQIRLTEFIQLSLDHSVNIASFIGAMYKYNKCDQRFGK